MWIIYSERFEDHTPVRWYYGTYENRDHANEVAIALNKVFEDHADASFCVCRDDNSIVETIKNMPVRKA